VSIAALMIVWGTLVTQSDRLAEEKQARWTLALGGLGCVLALGVFMTDAIRALPGGREAVVAALPVTFNWPLFSIALVLMSTPVVHLIYRAVLLRVPVKNVPPAEPSPSR
jgi:hypothetical protein